MASRDLLIDRVKGSLYGTLIFDAMAMPTHWYYGGVRQVMASYGRITGYVKPETTMQGSIMNVSNTGGGGRGGFTGDIIGKVIFHGKKKFWARGENWHYHHTLAAGDNTLEPLLMRRVLAVTAKGNGSFQPDALLADYVSFMTTPDSHNDTYCGTCHRMFFANFAKGVPPSKCPDNDNHNVDAIDSAITTIPIALLSKDDEETDKNVAHMIRLFRKSPESEGLAKVFARLLRKVVIGNEDPSQVVAQYAKDNRIRLDPCSADPVTA